MKEFKLTAKWTPERLNVDETEQPDLYFLSLYNENGDIVYSLCRIQQMTDEDEYGEVVRGQWMEIDIEAGCSTDESWDTLEEAMEAMETGYMMPSLRLV